MKEAKSIEEGVIRRLQRDLEEEVRITKDEKFRKLSEFLAGQIVSEDIKDSRTKEIICTRGKKLSEKHIDRIKDEHLIRIKLEDSTMRDKMETINNEANQYIRYLDSRYDEQNDRIKKGDELPPGVNKVVKAYIAMKRKIQMTWRMR